jgi:hypothetical protein
MHNPVSSAWLQRGLSILVTAAALITPLAHAALADMPAAPKFGPVIEDYAEYEGQKRCKPKAKPGLLSFQEVLQTTYPDSTWFGISRGCDIGGTSEHKEGRAMDWSRDATNPAQRKTVSQLFEWLFAEDEHGNENAMVRRLGIMYIIWNRQMWSSWDQEWEVYCVQKRKVCRDPDSKAAVHPHADHVHFSFGWPGAKMQTSYWNPELSKGEAPEPEPSVSPSPPHSVTRSSAPSLLLD